MMVRFSLKKKKQEEEILVLLKKKDSNIFSDLEVFPGFKRIKSVVVGLGLVLIIKTLSLSFSSSKMLQCLSHP